MNWYWWVLIALVVSATVSICTKRWGLFLLVVSRVTVPFFGYIGLVYAIIRIAFLKGNYWTNLNSYFMDMAKSDDQNANVRMSWLFNHIMVYGDCYPFGNEDEKISSVFGKNKVRKTLTWFGMFWSWFLNAVDENHVEDAIDNNVNHEL